MIFQCKQSLMIVFILFTALFAELTSVEPVYAATLTVNTLSDTDANDGLCSLREAVIAANTNADYNGCAGSSYGTDTITFNISGTIVLTAGLEFISDSLIINGTGNQAVTIDTTDAQYLTVINTGVSVAVNNVKIFNPNSGYRALSNLGQLTVSHTLFTNKNPDTYRGSAIFNSNGTLHVNDSTFIKNGKTSGSPDGGAIYNSGTMTVNRSVFTDNHSLLNGGAIYNSGTMTVNRSTFTGNSAAGSGAGLYTTNSATITNSTFSSNSATQFGGGIYSSIYANLGSLKLTNNTFTQNSAYHGAGVYLISIALMSNNIFANSVTGEDCYSNYSGITGSHNIIETGCDGEFINLTNTITTDPKIGALTGSPGYFPLLNGSPAIDAGSNTAASNVGLTIDQAGNPRFYNDTGVTDTGSGNAPIVDIGAVEKQTNTIPIPTISINDRVLNEGNTGTSSFNFTVSLSEATSRTVTVNYATGNRTAAAPGDYSIANGTLTFNPGETSKTITVLVNGDTSIESTESFMVDLSGAVNGVLADSRGIGTIMNDDGTVTQDGVVLIPVAPELPQIEAVAPVMPDAPVQPAQPTEAVPLMPAGAATGNPVMFMWRGATGASSYSLHITTEAGELVYQGTFSASVDCAGEICQALPDVVLTSGVNYLWSIQAEGQPRSFGMLFTYTPANFSPIVNP